MQMMKLKNSENICSSEVKCNKNFGGVILCNQESLQGQIENNSKTADALFYVGDELLYKN